MAERVRVREIDDDEGRRLLRIIRRGTGSVVTWRRAQMVLLSVQGIPVAKIAEVTFTSADRVRDMIHNFNADGFDSLYPKYAGGRPRTFTLPERREIKKIAKSKPAEHGLLFSTWSLAKLADFLVAEGVVDDISHEGLRVLLREEGVSFQRVKTWKASHDPDYAAKKARVEHLYAIADGEVIPEDGEPEVVFCLDEFGPLNLQPYPGRQWAERGGRHNDPDREPRRRRRATYNRPHGVRHLFAAYDLAKDKLYGHIKKTKNRSKFLEFCRYLRTLYPPTVRLVVTTTDPATLPAQATWYLATDLPRPGGPREADSPEPAADLHEVVRIYGIQHWIEQSYKQVKDELGWADFQVRSDTAIRRHQTLVTCAFSFCWDTWFTQPPDGELAHVPTVPPAATPAGPTERGRDRPHQRQTASWPKAIRAVRGLARPLDHAPTLLASLDKRTPATRTPSLDQSRRRRPPTRSLLPG
ncbi:MULTISPECIES: IS630 family transposase [unclassified Streptomyces]|uniref:IS630 family transposase n=1 Tax=unclassified Streptomyces TaxID=2593676 RepID=UPI0036E78F26